MTGDIATAAAQLDMRIPLESVPVAPPTKNFMIPHGGEASDTGKHDDTLNANVLITALHLWMADVCLGCMEVFD